MVDLHTHSTASDGSLSPAALVEAAAGRGLGALALTDHDTLDGLDGARGAAARLGIRFIPGVEFEITWEPDTCTVAPPGEFHLLGLGVERPGPDFYRALDFLGQSREGRNREIVGRLNREGIGIGYDEVLEAAGTGSAGRPHIADALIRRGFAKNHEQAFDRWLGKGRSCYVPRQGLRFQEAVRLIREAGGLPVLAHPLSLYVAWGRLPALVAELAERGLAGLEAWHPTAKPRAASRLEALGNGLGLFVTEGSDFHGASRPGRFLGCSSPGRNIDDAVLARLPL